MSPTRAALPLLAALLLSACGSDPADVRAAVDAGPSSTPVPSTTISAPTSAAPTTAAPTAAPAASTPSPSRAAARPTATARPAPPAGPGGPAGTSPELQAAADRLVRADADCEPEPGPAQVLVLAGATGDEVVAVECLRAAYQSTWELRRWDGSALGGLVVEQWDDGLVEDALVLGRPQPDGRLVSNVARGRGVGDCGTYSVWEYDGERLLLASAREQACDGTGSGEPEQWPQVHPRAE